MSERIVLTKAERDALWKARRASEKTGASFDPGWPAKTERAVEAIIDARLESVERERDEYVALRDKWASATARERRRAEDLRAKVEALADEYGQYETDVWAEDVAHNLRALLDGA